MIYKMECFTLNITVFFEVIVAVAVCIACFVMNTDNPFPVLKASWERAERACLTLPVHRDSCFAWEPTEKGKNSNDHSRIIYCDSWGLYELKNIFQISDVGI